jgi:hypothetical protein
MDTIQSNVKRFLNSSSWDVSLSEELEHGRVSGEDYLWQPPVTSLLDPNGSYL